MKIKFFTSQIIKKIKKPLQYKNEYYADGKPRQLCHKGLRAKFTHDGRLESYKTEHEYIEFGYTDNGDRFVKEYTSSPKFFFTGKRKALFEKFFSIK